MNVTPHDTQSTDISRSSHALIAMRGHVAPTTGRDAHPWKRSGAAPPQITEDLAECDVMTEQYWCPIRHARRVRGPHEHYRLFVDYGGADGYRRRLIPLRHKWQIKPSERRREPALR